MKSPKRVNSMMTAENMRKTFAENPHNWCQDGCRKALEKLADFPAAATISDIAHIIPSEWAYYWGLNIGDRAIMRDRVTESKWAYCWGLNMG